mgnify:CR=1 FL=1
MVPTVPQPVVKVPTTILACGISAFAPTGSRSVSKPDKDPFIPPEVYKSRRAGGNTLGPQPAGDVWACGVLLLKLLGGQLKDTVYPKGGTSSGANSGSGTGSSSGASSSSGAGSSSGTSGSSQGDSGVLFKFPAQQHSSLGEGTLELLTCMLMRQPQDRISLEGVRNHSWFLKGLAPNAHTMTDRFLKASPACKQSEDELRAVVDAAAAGPDAVVQILRQVKQLQHRVMAARQRQRAAGEATGGGLAASIKHQQQAKMPRQGEHTLAAAQQIIGGIPADPQSGVGKLQQAGVLLPDPLKQPQAQTGKQPAQRALAAQQSGKDAPLKQQQQAFVAPEQHGLQLQLLALRKACLQLHSVSIAGIQGSSSSSSSASKLTELLVAGQVAASAASTFKAMDAAAKALQLQSRLQHVEVTPLSQGLTNQWH